MMGRQLELFPETLEALCGQAGTATARAVECVQNKPSQPASHESLATDASFAAMEQAPEQRFLPLHLLHSGTRTYH
jgi:hypothetical protein